MFDLTFDSTTVLLWLISIALDARVCTSWRTNRHAGAQAGFNNSIDEKW